MLTLASLAWSKIHPDPRRPYQQNYTTSAELQISLMTKLLGKILVVVASQRSCRELNATTSYIAHNLLFNQKPLFKPNDRVLLVRVSRSGFHRCLLWVPKGKTLIRSSSSSGYTAKRWAGTSRKFLIAFRISYICSIIVEWLSRSLSCTQYKTASTGLILMHW